MDLEKMMVLGLGTVGFFLSFLASPLWFLIGGQIPDIFPFQDCHLGLSENWASLNPLVDEHFPYSNGHTTRYTPGIPYIQQPFEVILRGSAWCSATTPDAKFSQVVVPPVPLASEETEVALSRFKALEKRPRLPLVSQNGSSTYSKVLFSSMFHIYIYNYMYI